jgi:predicted enzyme related to lactoylglutathione lyase
VNITGFNLNITSEQPARLMAFYGETLGLPRDPEAEGGGFRVTESMRLFVDGHSEVHGAAKEPARMLINFMVADVRAERAALEAKGVTFIRKEGVEAWGGTISTFLDPDGNYLQLMQMPG